MPPPRFQLPPAARTAAHSDLHASAEPAWADCERPEDDGPPRMVRSAWWAVLHPAWFVSLLLHVAVLAVLAGVVMRSQFTEQPSLVTAILSDESPPEPAIEPVMEEALALEPPAPADSPAPLASLLRNAAVPDEAPAGTLARTIGGPGGATGDGTGGEGQGGTGPGGTGTGFFGTVAEGRSFVYVVDMSASMSGGRFSRAVKELLRSIGKLKSTQKFYVVFFNDQAMPLFDPKPAQGLVSATPQMKAKARRWISARHPDYTTDPVPALRIALSLKPEVIFLLSDGDFSSDVSEIIRQLNTNQVMIHTIAFEGQEGEVTLRRIAAENHGTYRFVK